MDRIKSTISQPAFITLLSFAAFAFFVALTSCFFDTKTNLCESSGLRCGPGQICAPNQAACVVVGGCGDGVVDLEKEACDDGNITDGDGCSMRCNSNETCGNEIVDEIMEEQCDYAAPNSSSCSLDCKLQRCGNRILDPGELCDDGNQLSNDGCTADCLSNEACGNNVLDPALGEECEFPNAPFPAPVENRAECDNDCTLPVCGDGHVNSLTTPPERCDPGIMEMGHAKDSESCDSDCTPVRCGDRHVNEMAGEECDQRERQ